MAHYGKSISGESSMWIGFAIAVGTIEAPRVWGLLSHLRMQKQAQKPQQQPNVVPLRPNGDQQGPIIDAFPTQG
jgi:hypothetical protein